jgi:ABC-type multidrug transport system ATPase subunit
MSLTLSHMSSITPLLQVLAGERAHHGKLTGTMFYDGRKPDSSFRRLVGFAVKQDTHLAHLTVFESLFFSARLRLPDALPDRVVKYRVKMAMKLLGISHTANTPVGDAVLRGISGGEKRRLGFGLEMVAGHSVILADLPTNGLDSATAYDLIRTMAFACRGGFSLMASLVQPSLELYLLLDRVMLLSKGRTIYLYVYCYTCLIHVIALRHR